MTAKIGAIDVQGFAGGFTLGVVQAGFELRGKRELPGGFGVASCEANRHLLGDKWETEVDDWEAWSASKDSPLVFGNPPCSGFSLLSSKEFRGVDSKINACMWALSNYAARCEPEIVIFESVQPAYKQGRSLMQKLRANLEEKTGSQYELIHVLHNAASVGGCAIRQRYFFVASRVPFGIEPLAPRRVPTLFESIGDLEGLAITWEKQPYRRPAFGWGAAARTKVGVDGHHTRVNPAIRRALDLMNDSVPWLEEQNLSMVARAYYERHGHLPESWHANEAKLIASDFKMGFYQLHRWAYDRPARVITGGATQLAMHPREDRTLTNRECARIQGFPDDWRIAPLKKMSGVPLFWGKGIPVQSGRWIAEWAHHALRDNPGSYTGEEIGERERVINVTHAWKGKAA